MRTIIVDDEPKAIELLKSYLQHFNAIEVVGTFRNGLKAFEFMEKEKIELIFLDINMPHLSGISLSKMINPKTKVIFTTAYSEYAVESYEVEAVDYLLKPISLERFTKAISKVLARSNSPANNSETLMIKSGTKIYRVELNDILYLEKDGNYMTYYLDNKKILARESVDKALQSLPENFIQIHKSYIVNLHKIEFINKDEISINRTPIPIGATFKDTLFNKIKS